MKTTIYSLNGDKKGEIELPEWFNEKVREDIIFKFLETHRVQQPYGTSVIAGKQNSASGIIRRKRHAWKISYGRGISRVPRKIMSQRGSQFNWVGAEVSGTVGGRRAHPPKSWKNYSGGKINKKEERIALLSALAATAQNSYVIKKYSSLNDKKIDKLPFIVDLNSEKIKTKNFLQGLKKILNDLYGVAIPEKKVRSGKGKMRGRKYKKNAGVLIVIGEKEKLKINGLDIKNAKEVSVNDLAKGGPGRLTVYTKNAIKELEGRVKQ